MLGSGKQVNLVRLLGLGENLFGFVALLGWEDGVRLGGRDGQGTTNGGQFILFDKGWVGAVPNVDAILVVADDVLL